MAKTQSDFFEQVYQVVRLIPKGRVTSYGAIAGYLGTRMSARMVGWAMNACREQSFKLKSTINFLQPKSLKYRSFSYK